ncbi:MAG: MBL fold metallo-hydrolase [Gaiellaceae bacterium]|jgi:glyoxylase-like metal-dependent hydrolase (beta-lactamase superfamily II)
MLIAAQVEVLDLEMSMFGAPSSVHPTLLWDEQDAVLIDAGFPGQLEALQAAIEHAGIPLGRLTKLIVTHQDIDHIGGISPLLAKEGDHIEVLAHELDRPYITGEKRLLKASPERLKSFAERMSSLPVERRETVLDAFLNTSARVDRSLTDGERLSYCGGIVVIHTPGHTPGHVCLYLERSRVLVAGDALNVVEGLLVGPNPQSAEDAGQAIASLKRLAPYDVKTVVCYHGGAYEGDVTTRIAELAAEPVSE